MKATLRDAIPRPAHEVQRLAALHRYQLLDTESEADFDLLVEVAAALCGTPYAFISLVDEDRVWYKAKHGRSATELPRDDDYCSWAILEDEMLYIPDLTQDRRTADLSLTVHEPY